MTAKLGANSTISPALTSYLFKLSEQFDILLDERRVRNLCSGCKPLAANSMVRTWVIVRLIDQGERAYLGALHWRVLAFASQDSLRPAPGHSSRLQLRTGYLDQH